MRDIELIVRFFAFNYFINEYQGNLKLFLDNAVKTLNEQWQDRSIEFINVAQDLDQRIEVIYEIFESNAFKKYKNGSFDSRFNRAVFDIMVYYFHNDNIRNIALQKRTKIIEGFKQLSDSDPQFVASFETSTKNIKQTSYRFTKWGEKLKEILEMNLNIPVIPNGTE